jgi:hypothetical protein
MDKTNLPAESVFPPGETVALSLLLSPVALNFLAAFRDLVVNDLEFQSQASIVRMILKFLR